MPDLLVGRDDLGTFTGSSFYGFESGNANVLPFNVVAEGTADTLNVAITNYNENSTIRFGIYEQTGGVGSFNLVRTINSPDAPSPQALTISPTLEIVTGNVYQVASWGDVSSEAGGTFYQSAIDPAFVAPNGAGIANGTYTTAPVDPLNTIATAAAGQAYWNLSGTILVPGNLGATATFITRGTSNPVPDENFEVTVFAEGDLTNILVPEVVVAASSGVILVDDQSLGVIGDVVWMAVRAVSEVDVDVAVSVVPVTVFDQDA